MPAKKSSAPKTESNVIFFVAGSDETDVKKTALALAQKLSPSDDPFATEIIDGAVSSADEAVQRIHSTMEALQTISMFGTDRLVWLKSANFLSDTVIGRAEAVGKALDRLLGVLSGGLPPGVRFLLSAPEPDKRRAAYKSLVKIAKTELRDRPDFGFAGTEADIAAWIEERAARAGLRFAGDSSLLLAARVGADSRQIDSEIEKLLAAGGGGDVDESMIRDLVPSTRQGGIFDLSNCITSRNLPGALETMRQLLRQKESAVGLLLAAIAPTFRNLLVVKDLFLRHRLQAPSKPFFFAKTIERLPEKAVAHLPRKKDGSLNAYPLGVAACGARNYELDELQRAVIRCRDLNRDLITKPLSEESQLGRFLVETLARPEKPPALR